MSFTNLPKVGSSFGITHKIEGQIDYIQTDTPDFVLLGVAEDEVLIWQERSTWTDITKN